MLPQDIDFQLVGPPLLVPDAAPGCLTHAAAHERTFGGTGIVDIQSGVAVGTVGLVGVGCFGRVHDSDCFGIVEMDYSQYAAQHELDCGRVNAYTDTWLRILGASANLPRLNR